MFAIGAIARAGMMAARMSAPVAIRAGTRAPLALRAGTTVGKAAGRGFGAIGRHGPRVLASSSKAIKNLAVQYAVFMMVTDVLDAILEHRSGPGGGGPPGSGPGGSPTCEDEEYAEQLLNAYFESLVRAGWTKEQIKSEWERLQQKARVCILSASTVLSKCFFCCIQKWHGISIYVYWCLY